MNRAVRAVVDRIENGYAVVLLGDQSHHLDWPLEYLPQDIGEGLVLSITVDIDADATAAAQQDIESMIQRLKSEE